MAGPARWRGGARAGALALMGWLAAAGAVAQQPADPMLAEFGGAYFAKYCASCHGASGRGDGPVAPALRPPLPDLTRIAARRGGSFPAGEIAGAIDGRFHPPAHGSREMPVWGERFSEGVPEAGVGESLARGKIAVLVEYLKSIQERTGQP